MTAATGTPGRKRRRAKGWLGKTWRSLNATMQTMDERNLGLIAAGCGFFTMLALFPGIAALIAIWGIAADPVVVQTQVAELSGLVPDDAFDLIDTQLRTLVTAQTGTLGWTTAISTTLSIFWANNGVMALVRGLNAVYREDHRGTIARYVSALMVTLVLIAMAIVALAAVVVAPLVLRILPVGPLEAWGIEAARWVIAGGALVFGLGVIYRYGPNRRAARVPWISAGTVVAIVIWGLGSYAFGLYLSNFGRYNEIYGSIGAVVALLMWLYLSAYVILLGAALNAELELRTLPDTTVGPDRPMGERGAFVADTYVRN
jgi:membrane protein